MFLEIGDACCTLFNMVIYETQDKEKEKKKTFHIYPPPQFLEKVSKIFAPTLLKIKTFVLPQNIQSCYSPNIW